MKRLWTCCLCTWSVLRTRKTYQTGSRSSPPATTPDIQVRPISSASRRYSWKLIFGPAHAQTNVRYTDQPHQQRQPQVQLEAYLRSCACAYKCQISRSGPSAAPAAGTDGSLSSVLRMRKQMSHFWHVRYGTIAKRGVVWS
jgi:hypothetical protein